VKNAAAALVESDRTKNRGRSHALLHALMFIVTFCWAANIIAGKVILRNMGPLALAQLRATAGAVVFGTLFLGWRGRSALRLGSREWIFLAKAALFGITLNQLFFIGGIGRTSAAHAGLIVALGPVMVLTLACAMRLEDLTPMKLVGTIVAFCGVAVLAAAKSAASSGASIRGDAILLASTVVFAYYTILMKEVAGRYDVLTLNATIFGLGALFMIPFSARALLSVQWAGVAARAWWCVAFMVVLGTTLSYLFYVFALTNLSAARVAAFAYLQPVIAIALGTWLLAEKLTVAVVIGGVLVLAGVYLTERESAESKG
jgi:drug/metabolite transporter (DMT)-like permease